MAWEIKQLVKPKITNPILIEGLPGMGNVGKIAVDFIINSLKAKKLLEIHSYNFPHCVFVNEDNLVELPSIEMYYKNINGRTLLLLSGDVQPLDEQSCYDFCNKILDTFEKDNGKEIVTLGGIGLQKVPLTPKVYCTGNDKKIIDKYIFGKVSNQIHGRVGPIVGVSGLLAGLAGKRKIPAVTLLAETFGHPQYLGVKGAKEILKVINKKFGLKLDLQQLEGEIEEIEKEIKERSENMETANKIKKDLRKPKHKGEKPLSKIIEQSQPEDVNYIG